ncbi:MAG: amidohydrolase/deacetylase family metallohydrolase [Acidobacteria bacterium]|nr:amidohydrolase/deacetylase family metallohydrolase [Acidobacteriota bacterium]
MRACAGFCLAACTSVPQLAAAQSASQAGPGASSAASAPVEEKQYDLLLKGGHVIDAKNNIDAIRDVAIKDGKIAKVAAGIPANSAIKTVNVAGLYVTPGLIDMHVHVFWGLTKDDYAGGDWAVAPDGVTLRDGVTTVVDAGSSGWRNFETFKERVIDRSQTRVLAELNIVGAGMGSGPIEQNKEDMDGEKTAEMALKYPNIVVGIKSAHFTGPEWFPYEQAVKAGTIAHIPVMIDFGSRRPERPLYQLLEEKLRPGDIYTHMYGGSRGEQDPETGGPGKGMWEGRKRGIYFDVGHGQSSFLFSVAVPLIKAGFIPDSISTDIHSDNLNEGLKDQLTTADKFLAMGLPLKEVIAEMTWHPAVEVQQTQLGHLSEGAIADVAVLNVHHGDYGFIDGAGAVLKGHERLECELTIKDGKFVYDLNGLSAPPWNQPPGPAEKQAKKWTSLRIPTGLQRPMNPQMAARMARFPPRWQPYETDANGKVTVKAAAKLPPPGVKRPKLDVPPQASTWAKPPYDSWPAARK